MVNNMSDIEFVDYDDLDRILRIVHDTQLHKQIMLPLHRKNIMMSWWYAHLYALQEYHRDLVHPEYKDITPEATVEAHGGLVPYTRHALCLAQTIFKTIEHSVGKQAMADQNVWGRTALPSAWQMGGLREMIAINGVKAMAKTMVCSRMGSTFNRTHDTWCVVASVAKYRCSFEPVYYSTHFDMACDHFWHKIMKEDIGPQWAPNLYFRKRCDRFEVQVGRFKIQM
jgi:hypothetical protein